MRKYRTVVRDRQGPYVAYVGSELDVALATMEHHVAAETVYVDRYEPAWGGYWKCIQGVWR